MILTPSTGRITCTGYPVSVAVARPEEVTPNQTAAVPSVVAPLFFNPQAFDTLIGDIGPRVVWAQSHTCPCTQSGYDGAYAQTGGARPDCQTCFGLGTYWDSFSAPFRANITFGGFLPMPYEPGIKTDQAMGNIQNATPLISIPYTQSAAAWLDASQYDQIVEVDTQTRYSTTLTVGQQEALPFFNGLTIAPAGAVAVWNPATKTIGYPTYAVAGSRVVLSGYPVGTPLTVDFLACATYVLVRQAGALPHQRPLAGGTMKFPRRFTADTLDLWLRGRSVVASPPTWNLSVTAQATIDTSASSRA